MRGQGNHHRLNVNRLFKEIALILHMIITAKNRKVLAVYEADNAHDSSSWRGIVTRNTFSVFIIT